MNMRKLLLVSSAFALLAFHSTSYAEIIFSDFGPGNHFDTYDGRTVSTASSSAEGLYSPAMGFSSSIDADLTQLDLAIQHVDDPLNTRPSLNTGTTISLYTNVGNALGSLLGSWTLGTLPIITTDGGIATISGITDVHLNAGGSYYLLAQAAGDDWNAWMLNDIGTSGPTIIADNFRIDTLGAFDVIGTPTTTAVPLPGTLPLFAAGLGALGLLAWRRRRKTSVA
jgi:hypothetical protein